MPHNDDSKKQQGQWKKPNQTQGSEDARRNEGNQKHHQGKPQGQQGQRPQSPNTPRDNNPHHDDTRNRGPQNR